MILFVAISFSIIGFCVGLLYCDYQNTKKKLFIEVLKELGYIEYNRNSGKMCFINELLCYGDYSKVEQLINYVAIDVLKLTDKFKLVDTDETNE